MIPRVRSFRGGFPPGRGVRGYVLLEIIIALTIFAVVAVGLSVVLHSSLDSANTLRRQASIRRGLEAVLVEARQKPKREEMVISFRDEALGMEFRSELEELKWLNRDGRPVRGLYILRAIATDLRPENPRNESAEVYVYRP